MKSLLGLSVALTVAVSLAASVSAASPQSGTLKIYKDCSEYTGRPGSFCTIRSSSLHEIRAGSKVVYLQPTSLTSNVVLHLPAPAVDKAFGKCSLSKTGNGKCTFTGGTGMFVGFHADLRVTHLGDPTASPFYYWQGQYSFSGQRNWWQWWFRQEHA